MDVQNPFRFTFIRTCRAVRDLDDLQPAVVLASPGFLNSGPSRQLFDRCVSIYRCMAPTCLSTNDLSDTIQRTCVPMASLPRIPDMLPTHVCMPLAPFSPFF